ncbi:hypothetical protein [Streptomyces sp. NPDC015125]
MATDHGQRLIGAQWRERRQTGERMVQQAADALEAAPAVRGRVSGDQIR